MSVFDQIARFRGPAGNQTAVIEMLRAGGPSSQADLVRLSGLSRGTINTAVRELQAQGAVLVVPANGREDRLTLVPGRRSYAVVQLGLEELHAIGVDFATNRRAEHVVKIRSDDDSASSGVGTVVEAVQCVAEKLGQASTDFTSVALSMHAPVNFASGAISAWAAVRLPRWRDVPVAAALTEAIGVPVIVDNDGNFAALAEWTWGAGQGTSDFFYVMCSDGIGGGMVLNGQIYRGGNGTAGEIGHIVLERTGELCFCGSRGCLTTFASERFILKALEDAGNPKRDLQDVIDAARADDLACQHVLADAGRHLGRGLANTAKVLAPNVIAIGGVLGTAGSLVFKGLRSSIELNSLHSASPTTRLSVGQLGPDVVLLGGLAGLLEADGRGLTALPSWLSATNELVA